MREMDKFCILSFLKEGDLGIAKNYRSITPTAIAAKFYNALLFNCIKPEIEKNSLENLKRFL